MTARREVDLDKLLPYPRWRKGQYELAEFIYSNLGEERTLLIEAPTGFGKTIPTLIAAFKKGVEEEKDIIYLVRTKNEAQAPFTELTNLRAKVGVDIWFSVFQNKRDVCAFKEFRILDYEEFLLRCKMFRDRGICRFFPEDCEKIYSKVAELFFNSRSLEEAYDKILSNGICPYEAMRCLSKDSNVIIGTYPYIFKEDIRKVFLHSINKRLEDSILIVDEAHNLPEYLMNTFSFRLSVFDLKMASREASKFMSRETSREFISLMNLLEKWIKSLASTTNNKIKIVRNFGELIVFADDISRFRSEVNAAYLRYIARRNAGRSYLLYVYRCLSNVLKTRMQGYILYVSKTPVTALVYQCINPSVRVGKIFSKPWSVILMSGTLPLREYLELMLGLRRESTVEYRVEGRVKEATEIFVAKDVTTKFEERSEHMFEKYADYIYNISRLARNIVLVVAPSYNLLRKLLKLLLLRGLKTVIIERENTRIEGIVRKIKGLRRRGAETIVLLAVAGGKLTEGIEIVEDSKSLINTVVIVGVPYPEPSPLTEEMIKEMNKLTRDPRKAWESVFEAPATIKILQAIGRSLRSKRDKATIFLLDRRFIERDTLKNLVEQMNEDYNIITLEDFKGYQ
ncbi:MAG: ATP-dependent DNA helicase [Thermoproteales archaeon]|nr:ATP-dependent DNA helicase [Thermoproteales archaeon]